jgi:hypothetical protein
MESKDLRLLFNELLARHAHRRHPAKKHGQLEWEVKEGFGGAERDRT